VRIARGKKKVPQSLKVGMGHDRVHEVLRDALSTVLRDHENVAEPRERRLIGHHAREGDLRRAAIGLAIER
jgi:hypothetical protein